MIAKKENDMDRKMIRTFYRKEPIKLVVEMSVRLDESTMQYIVDIPEQHLKVDEILANDRPIWIGE